MQPPGYPPQPPPGQPPYGQPQYGQPPYGYPPPQPPPAPKGTNPLVIILAVLGALMVIGFGSCALCVGLGAKGVADHAEKVDKEHAQAKTKTERVDLSDLLDDYKNNEVKGDKKYKGKYIRFKGVATDVKKGLVGDQVYVMIGTGKQFEIPEVQCYIGKANEDDLSRISKGDKVTAVGRVDGLLMNVQVQDCDIE